MQRKDVPTSEAGVPAMRPCSRSGTPAIATRYRPHRAAQLSERTDFTASRAHAGQDVDAQLGVIVISRSMHHQQGGPATHPKRRVAFKGEVIVEVAAHRDEVRPLTHRQLHVRVEVPTMAVPNPSQRPPHTRNRVDCTYRPG